MEDTRMCRERAVLPVTMRWCRMDRLSYPLFMLIRSGGHRPQQEERQRERERAGVVLKAIQTRHMRMPCVYGWFVQGWQLRPAFSVRLCADTEFTPHGITYQYCITSSPCCWLLPSPNQMASSPDEKGWRASRNGVTTQTIAIQGNMGWSNPQNAIHALLLPYTIPTAALSIGTDNSGKPDPIVIYKTSCFRFSSCTIS